MKFPFLSILLLGCFYCASQDNVTVKRVASPLNESTIVKDTSGTIYAYAAWRQLLATGHYSLRPEDPQNTNTSYIITRLTDQEYAKKNGFNPQATRKRLF